jgi:hypothetical protein
MPWGSGGFWGVCAKSIDEQMSAIRQPEIYVLRDIDKLDDDLKLIRDQGNFMKIRTALPTVNEQSSAAWELIPQNVFSSPAVYAWVRNKRGRESPINRAFEANSFFSSQG